MIPLLITIGVIALSILAGYKALAFLRHREDHKRERELVFLQILTPKKESKEDKEQESEQFSTGKDFKEVLGIMDHLYQTLSSLHDSSIARHWKGSPFISVEYACLAGEILIFVVAPRSVVGIVEKHITSFYPDAVIDEVEDYNIFTKESVTANTYLVPTKSYVYPFKTYAQLKSDPFNAITNAFSKLKKEEGAAVQLVLRPVASKWQGKLQKEAQNVINPKKKESFEWWNPLFWVKAFFDLFTSSDKDDKSMGGSERVSQMVEELSKAIDEKAGSPGFTCMLRVVSSGENAARANLILNTIVGSFTQFNDVRGNSFARTRYHDSQRLLAGFIRRSPGKSFLQKLLWKKMLLGTAELASFFHFPNIKYNKVSTIKWQNFKIAPAPKNIPEKGLFLGYNTVRGEKTKVYMNSYSSSK